ncbi:MAG: hypothetical protein ACTSV5_12395 [Promethearchaeota archaeon]
MTDFEKYEALLRNLGKYKTGLYIKKLKDIDSQILREIVSQSIDFVRKGEIRY